MKSKRNNFQLNTILFSGIFMLFLCFGFAQGLSAAENPIQTIRVAYPIQEGLTEVDEAGNYSGYTYEYLEEIAQYTGWNYEFVQVDGTPEEQLEQLRTMLENGEVDLMGTMLYSAETDSRCQYASQSYGTVETVLETISSRAGELSIDAYNMQTMRMAVLATTGQQIDELEAYCEMNLVTPQYVLCDDQSGQLQAILDGRADVMLNTSVNPVEGVQTVGRFAPKPFYFAVSQNAAGTLLHDLDQALKHVVQASPTFSATLYKKYFSPGQEEFVLNDEEREHIAQTGPLRLGVVEDQPPYYADGHGITTGIAELLMKKTGLKLDIVAATDRKALYQMLKDGEIDLMAGVAFDYDNARMNGFSMTEPYLTAQYILMMNPDMDKNDMNGKRLALTTDSPYHGYTVGRVIHFANMSECVRAVIDGDADYTYVDAYTAQYFSNLPEYWDLRQTPLSYYPLELCFGLSKPIDGHLMSILNHAILSITLEERQAVVTSSIVPDRRMTISYLLREYPIPIAIGFAMLLIILCIWIWQYARSKRQLQSEMEKRNQIYDLIGDHFFEYNHQNHCLTIQNTLVHGPNGPMEQFHAADLTAAGETGGEFLKIVRSGDSGVFEIQDFCVDGLQHWLSIAQKNLYDESGKLSCTLGRIKIIDKEMEQQTELVSQAQRDGLTGLYNSRTFQNLLDQKLALLVSGKYSALLLLDIDYFKKINDIYGHLQGDKALCWTSDMLKKHVGPDGIAGRYGGDEFIAYISQIHSKIELKEFCEEFCKMIGEQSQTDDGRLTVSLGAVLISRTEDYASLFRLADCALYKAKTAGRNRSYILEQTDA